MENSYLLHDIVGQEKAVHFLKSYLTDPVKIPPLLIFHGPSSVGKESMADRFSRQLLCFTGTSCGICKSCKSFNTGLHPDFIVFPSTSDKKIKIGDPKNPVEFTIRWLQKTRINFIPHLSKYRIVLFPDASLIEDEAESAMLKILEESPSHTKYIFIVKNLNELKETIVSRGVCIPFKNLSIQTNRELHRAKGLVYENFFGGSIGCFSIPFEIIESVKYEVEENIRQPVLRIQLENWIRNYDIPKEYEGEFSYSDFLDLISLLIIDDLAKEDIDKNLDKILKVFEFKKNLHKKIPGLDPYLISKLFFDIA
ncbi:MAG: hypothetical protein L6Q54_01650 [Leptospiraceae bacterium]|nr:hypothetical protein [Leptospiraceae bacterium]MCK6379943.1 hypothetical protein [Leptospiraceae bacterium]NUM41462.1 hypothetical protein [Leptospiraceae bacterium]